jgi:2-polyprenyl-3-methyl-5-hydroxy-6-metoxy-1,4-benzoquinol methylase
MTEILSPRGTIIYRDSEDHFANGLLRLMNITREDFSRWLALSEQAEGDLPARLRGGWLALRPPPEAPEAVDAPVGPGPRGLSGRVWHPAIAESPGWGVAVNDAESHAWLVRWDGARFALEQDPPEYEEEYFEGDKLAAGGYGDYTAQAGWRMEKSARQVAELQAITGLRAGRVLDIGSGYGFFRVALRDAGFEQEGLEVSAFARTVAQSSYDLESHGGLLGEHWTEWTERFDVVAMFDLIEHLRDPEELLAQTASVLRPGGYLAVKTPNIDCPEAEVFGPWYHSLKREHLGFFSARSLTAAAARHGLEPVHVGTLSHLLQGFVGTDQTTRWAKELRGADLDAWYRRVG